MSKTLALLVFFVLVVGGGLMIGALTAPGSWYAALEKPAYNPPDRIFGPVWSALYVLIAIAGWRVWRQEPAGWPMRLWGGQLVLNFAWSPVFFVAHRIDLALMIVLALFVTIIAFVAITWRLDRVAAALFVPYAAWVGFASLLNASILALN